MRITVLGGGRVGAAIAKDLAEDREHTVTVVDRSAQALAGFGYADGVVPVRGDLGDPGAVRAIVEDHDLVIGAVPGALGFQTAKAVLEAGKHIVDISFFPEDPSLLDEPARRAGVTAVIDCGVAPGLSNMVLGHVESELDHVRRYECFVGGLPVNRTPPWAYRAPFSPADVLEEYRRPARLRRDGHAVTVPALSEIESVHFPEVGELEAFNTDGLRTLLHTTTVPDLSGKTLRYPGHARRIIALRDAGFFGTEPVRVGGMDVRPIDVTSRLLFDQWYLSDDERDLTVMRIIVEGRRGEEEIRRQFDLLDYYDDDRRVASMSRTTGYTCAAVARLVANGSFRRPGIVPPEYIGRDSAAYSAVIELLAARGVTMRHTDTVYHSITNQRRRPDEPTISDGQGRLP
jgi:saccharopine dehydrogenase-like NADP-dependent oxidoreductase